VSKETDWHDIVRLARQVGERIGQKDSRDEDVVYNVINSLNCKLMSVVSSGSIPMRLECPSCHELHIDEGEFATKAHHTHACQHCGDVWRPAIVHTVWRSVPARLQKRMSHCGRDPSTVGCCGGTDETCSCECTTCQCPNCSLLHSQCKCVKYYFCIHCKLTPDDPACALTSCPHDWDWTF
jgi:hypothetical protein